MKYEFTPQAHKNLLLMLNRVPITGFAEQDAMQEIRYILSNPLQEAKEPVKEKEGARTANLNYQSRPRT